MGKIKKGLGYVVAVEQYVCCALLVVMLSICFVALSCVMRSTAPLYGRRK